MSAPELSPAELAFLDRPYAPESLVERVAAAMCDHDGETDGYQIPWDKADTILRDHYRRTAQHAINAMKGEPL